MTTHTTEVQKQIFDALAFRDIVGHYASGITIVTGLENGEPVGFTCQSFYSVSIEPVLVSISVMNTSTTYPKIRPSGKFAVNILGGDQSALSNQFARSGTDKWAGVEWSPSPETGNPILEGAVAWFDCTVYDEYVAGDHTIIFGEVSKSGKTEHEDPKPLIFFKGRYHTASAL